MELITTADYKAFISEIKQRIHTAQIKAAVRVNTELLRLYWDLAERIVANQQQATWGTGFFKQMSNDLRNEFPGMKGFSIRNLERIRQWYCFWSEYEPIATQVVSQLPQGNFHLDASEVAKH